MFTDFFIRTNKITLLLIGIFIYSYLHGQSSKLGLPEIQNHGVKEYKAGAQNWDVKYYSGHVYFANNDGLLVYDGNSWQTFYTPNQTIIRSLFISEQGHIYVGAQNELGYFATNSQGSLQFHSLLDADSPDFGEIWHLELADKKVYFSDIKSLYCLENGKIKQIKGISEVEMLYQNDGEVWVLCENKGLIKIDNKDGKIETILNNPDAGDLDIVEICKSINGEFYIATSIKGIFKYANGTMSSWATNADEYIKEKIISSMTYNKDYGISVGTYQGGFVNINENGRATIKMDKSNGMRNNSVSCLTYDEYGTLWLGLFNGIDEVYIKRPFYKFYPDNDLQGSIYDVDIWDDKLFFSTSNGLFYKEMSSYNNPFDDQLFQVIEGTQSQTWSTDVINNKLYCSNQNGAFIINKELTISQLTNKGAWKFQKLDDQFYALGHYEGISIFRLNTLGELEYSHEVEGINESCRIIELDKDKNLWVAHPFKKIFKINFQNQFTKSDVNIYSGKDGLQEDLHNYVAVINGVCHVTNKSGIYKYNRTEDRFEKDSITAALVSQQPYVRRIKMIGNRLWFINDATTFSVDIESEGLSESFKKSHTLNISTKENYVGGFEDIFELNQDLVIIPTQEGAYYYNLSQIDTTPPQIRIKNISLPDNLDTIIYNGFGNLDPIILESHENTIKFLYGIAQPRSEKENLYSVRLIGAEDNWSNWQSEHFKEYTNLNNGEYTLQIKTKNSSHVESDIYSFDFTVKTPWYKSYFALIFYIVMLLSFLVGLVYIPRKKYEETTARLEDENQNKEEQLNLIKREKLEDEIKFKNQELASTALHLLQKNQTLNSVRDKVNSLKDKPNNSEIKKDLNEIISIIRSDLRLDEDWSKFSLHFDQVHQDFIKKLKAQYPKLSTKDHKLCAFLKMNLTTKEIAPLLNISVRGVEIGRYRLRKKLELDRKDDLSLFLNEL